MADGIADYLQNARDKVVGAVKSGAAVLDRAAGFASTAPPMAGRLPLGEAPKTMPTPKTMPVKTIDSKIRPVK